jgi:putative peptidoglycan lipid II flippase
VASAIAMRGLITRAAESPLVRGGLTLAGGVVAGNLIGFLRVVLTAYLLGTHSRADSLAVAMGPVDTLNSVLINSMVFAFVPMLAAREGLERTALFLRLRRAFIWVFPLISAVVIAAAPRIMRLLAPGLNEDSFRAGVDVLRILGLSTMAAGVAAIYWALLYTERRFAPTAFYQATLNLCTIFAALALWQRMGVYAFAAGYTAGAGVQLVYAHFAARQHIHPKSVPACAIRWREILTKPAFFLVYAAALGLNVTFTRAYATHGGPGMAAALEYCMRGVGVPLAIIVSPAANSLLPEIARLRSLLRLREALRLIDRSIFLSAVMAAAMCLVAILLRRPVIELMFQRGSFTPESTRLVSAVFLGFAPTLVGWSLLEITSRSLFALDRPWPPVLVSAVPVLVNALITVRLGLSGAEWTGLGAAVGVLAGFAVLFLILVLRRGHWLRAQALAHENP